MSEMTAIDLGPAASPASDAIDLGPAASSSAAIDLGPAAAATPSRRRAQAWINAGRKPMTVGDSAMNYDQAAATAAKDNSTLQNFSGGAAKAVLNIGAGGMALASRGSSYPELYKQAGTTARAAAANIPAEPGVAATTGGFAGGALMTGPAMMIPGPQIPAVMATMGAAQGAGNAFSQADAMREAGQQVDPNKEHLAALGNAIVGALAGYFGGKALPLGGGSVPGRVASNVAMGSGIGAGQAVGENAVAQQTLDPDRKLSEGVLEAAVGGGVQQGLFSALHEGVNAARNAAQPKPAAPDPNYPVMPPLNLTPEQRAAGMAELMERQRLIESNRNDTQLREAFPPGGEPVKHGPDIAENLIAYEVEQRAERTPIRPSPDEEGAEQRILEERRREDELDRQAEDEIAQAALERFQRGSIGHPYQDPVPIDLGPAAGAEPATSIQFRPDGVEIPGHGFIEINPDDPPYRQHQLLIEKGRLAPDVARRMVSEWEASRGQGSGDSPQERPVADSDRGAAAAPDEGLRVAQPADVPPVETSVSEVVRGEGPPAGDQPGNVGGVDRTRINELADALLQLEDEQPAAGETADASFERSRSRLMIDRALDAFGIDLHAPDRLDQLKQKLAEAGFDGPSPLRDLKDARRREVVESPSTERPSIIPPSGVAKDGPGRQKLRMELQARVEKGGTVQTKYLERFKGEAWADELLAARKPRATPAEDALGQRRSELQKNLRDAVARELGAEVILKDKPEALQLQVMRGDKSPGSVVAIEDAIAHVEKLPAEHPARLILHNLQELEKNPRGTKVQKYNTSQVEDGSRVVVNDGETFTIDREEGVVKDGITVPIPEGGIDVYGKKILPPVENSVPAEIGPDGMPAPITNLNAGGGQRASAGITPPPAPRIRVAPVPGGDPKQLREIVLDFGKALGKKIRAVKTEPKSSGTYYPGSTKTAIRFAGDLDVSAHEIGHFLDDQYDLVGSWARSATASPFDAELIPNFSGYGSVSGSGPRSSMVYQRAEGVAEWIRAYVVNPKQAMADAPQFAKHFLGTVPDTALRAIQAFSDDVRRFAGLESTGKVLSNVNTRPADAPGWIKSIKDFVTGGDDPRNKMGGWDRIRTYLQDDLAGVFTAAKELKQIRTDLDIKPSRDPEILMRTWAGENGKYQDILEHGPVKYKPAAGQAFERAPGVDGGVEWLMGADLMKGKTSEQATRIHELAVARLVSERVLEKAQLIMDEAKGRIALLDPADPNYKRKVDAINRVARQKTARLGGFGGGIYRDPDVATNALFELNQDPELARVTKDLAARYRTWADANLRYWVDSGRLSEKAYSDIKSENQQYAAMHRLIESIEPKYLPGAKRLGSVSEPVKRFKGSTQQMESPYVNLLEQTYTMTREADRNAAVGAFVDLLRNEKRGMYMADRKDLDYYGSRAKPGDRDAIKLYHQGKEEYWHFAPEIHQALKGWGESNNPWPIASFIMKTLPQTLITHSPDFVIRQLFRDPVTRTLVSDVGSKPHDVLRRFSDKEVSGLRLGGGEQSGYTNTDPNAFHKMIRDQIKRIGGEKNTILALPGKILGGYSKLTQELGEGRSRLAEYSKAYEHAKTKLGHSEHEAMIYAAGKARGLIDYAVMGRFMRKVSPYLPFVNANIQGPVRMYRAAVEHPKAFAAMFSALVLAPRLAMYAWNARNPDIDEEYRQLPAWRRDFFLNFKLNHVWFSIPNPYEAGVAGAGVERMITAERGKTK